jgi:predicted ferric reductase
VTIKAVGDYTRELFEQLRPGVPARLAGPFGAFDYRRGGRGQVWIAGGIGITPFLSWIRSLDGDFDREVDLFYTVAHRAEAIHTDEIRAAADAHPSLRPHVLSSDTDGRLRAEDVLRGERAPLDLHVRAAADDTRAGEGLPASRRSRRPRAVGGLRCPLNTTRSIYRRTV